MKVYVVQQVWGGGDGNPSLDILGIGNSRQVAVKIIENELKEFENIGNVLTTYAKVTKVCKENNYILGREYDNINKLYVPYCQFGGYLITEVEVQEME